MKKNKLRYFQRVFVKNIIGLKDIIDIINISRTPTQLLSNLNCEVIRKQPFKTLLKININNTYYYLKIWWDLNLIRVLKNFYRGDLRACREAKGLLLLNKYSFRTPKLITFGYVEYSWLNNHSYIMTEEIKNCQTLDEYFANECDEKIIKYLSERIYSMHKNNLIYGDFHYGNVLVAQESSKKELYFLDWMGVRKCIRLEGKLSDDANFIYYANPCSWINKDKVIRLFLTTYLEFYSRSNNEYFATKYLLQFIANKISQKQKLSKMYTKFINLG